MKIRKGFVSNSSSSSFVCDACGAEESGMNLSLDNTEMSECLGGHTICCGTLEDDTYDKYNYPSENCPCCTFKVIGDWIVLAYLLNLSGKDKATVVKEISDKFNNDNEFWTEMRK